ncbi:MAG: VapE family protein [Rhodoferax sp.]|uniref:VapE domain-containing protein n=1 Tax=Rhodoferax sp. TaxID=50421 RepID=UPI0026212967|nr:VapE domain-containing protein [Rhodoferax sp.]MDD5336213.1 VapE family protein [Rhodoferax sp.]
MQSSTTTTALAEAFDFGITPAAATAPAQTVTEALAALPEIFPAQSKPKAAAPSPAWQTTKEAFAGAEAAINEGLPEGCRMSMDSTLDKTGFPHPRFKKTKDGFEISGLKNSIENLAYMLKEYGITGRYNEMRRLREVDIPGAVYSKDNIYDRQIDLIYSLAVRNDMTFSRDWINNALSSICEQDCFHPVREWIESKEWDGVSRIGDLIETLKVEPQYVAQRNMVMPKWLVGAVAALYKAGPGVKFECALTMQGEQGEGKSSWFKALCKPSLGAVLENYQLNPDSKDSVFTLAGHWIVELGELESTFSKSAMGKLKGFMSNSADKLRRPYAVGDSEMQRQTVIGATVNRADFLIDDTGNRRWWTVPVKGVDFMHGIDMQQLWTEVKTLVDAGAVWHLNRAENLALSGVNDSFMASSPVAEKLHAAFDLTKKLKAPTLALVGMEQDAAESHNLVRMTATDMLELLDLPMDKRHTGEVGAVLRKHVGDPKKSNGMLVWTLKLRTSSGMFSQVPARCRNLRTGAA